MVAQKTLASFRKRMNQLYDQGQMLDALGVIP